MSIERRARYAEAALRTIIGSPGITLHGARQIAQNYFDGLSAVETVVSGHADDPTANSGIEKVNGVPTPESMRCSNPACPVCEPPAPAEGDVPWLLAELQRLGAEREGLVAALRAIKERVCGEGNPPRWGDERESEMGVSYTTNARMAIAGECDRALSPRMPS